jgi:YegS/Rv2252/BmrU family lipid kinase
MDLKEIKKKVLLIVNPCAGKTKSRISSADIVEKFSKKDYDFTMKATTCQGDATNIVKNKLSDHDMVVCCGGDGTLNETINGVMDMPRRVPIGYVPSGTTCDFATTLGIPADAGLATDIIMKGNINEYDIGLFNNRYFTYIATFGAFTQNSYTTPQKLKNRFGHAAYVFSAAKEIKDIHGIHMRVEYDGGVVEDDFCFGSISNSSSVGGMFKLREDDVRLNDGEFEVFLVRKMPFPLLIKTILEVMNQIYNPDRVLYFKTSKIKLVSPYEDVKWSLDGEFGGAHREVMIHNLERAIKLITPNNPLFIRKEDLAAKDAAAEAETTV